MPIGLTRYARSARWGFAYVTTILLFVSVTKSSRQQISMRLSARRGFAYIITVLLSTSVTKFSTPLYLAVEAPGDFEGFLCDAGGDLGVARNAVGKRNRNLLDEKPRLPRPVVHLQLERISSRRNSGKINLLKRRLPPALEAACRIPHRHSSDGADEDSASARNEATLERPARSRAARNIPRADDEIGEFFLAVGIA